MADSSGSSWFSFFNDTAEKLLGASADSLYEHKLTGDGEYERTFNNALFKTVVAKCRVKQEMVNDEPRVKSSVIKVDELDYVAECKNMLDAIAKYN
jgi:replication factor A1